jgi:hypothetical protein
MDEKKRIGEDRDGITANIGVSQLNATATAIPCGLVYDQSTGQAGLHISVECFCEE